MHPFEAYVVFYTSFTGCVVLWNVFEGLWEKSGSVALSPTLKLNWEA